MNSHYFRVSCVLVLAIFGLGCASLLARTMDITEVDLFSMKRWNSADVSVQGLRLGMSLHRAEIVLSKEGLGLFDDLRRTPCGPTSRSCFIARKATYGGTVNVALKNGGMISAINIGMPEDPTALSHTIAGCLKGATRELFFHYSHGLREKLLGVADRIDKSEQTRFMQFTTYSYCRLGLRFYTERLGRRGTNQLSSPQLMSIEFFSTSQGCLQKR